VIPEEKIERLVRNEFRLKPRDIIEALDLRRPIYQATAAFGHPGRAEPGFTWERVDRAAELRAAAGVGGAVPVAAV